ncbi:MAG: FAD-dependent oxidoreductase [Candidatus Shapirobacteria bacterium]|jgi:protoporphyrinogen oxidase
MAESYDVLILGAGVAGLSCADEILRDLPKTKLLVLEKNKYVGGLAATIREGGYNYDLAPHRWYTKNEELNKWLTELIGKEMITVKKLTPMYQFGKFFEYPIRISDVVKNISPTKTFYMFLTYLWEKIRSVFYKRKIITMKDAYVSRFGWGLYKWFNREYNDKLWGENGCETMSADFVNQRVKNLSMVTALTNALGFNRNKVISLVPEFKYPKMGAGRISEKLAERIRVRRGKISLGEDFLKIKKQGDKYVIKTSRGQYLAKHVISSIPLDKFMANFTDIGAGKLRYIDQKIVVLFAKGKRLTNFTWVYVHPKNIKTFRFMETNNWSPAMSPPGKTSLVFEYPYQKGDEIEKMSDNELVETTISDFLKYFAPKGVKMSDILGSKVYWIPGAYPKYDLSYVKPLEDIYGYAKKHLKNVQLVGRNGMFHYNNLDHSIYTGILAAKNFVAGKNIYDLNLVNNEAEYLEEIRK